MRRFFQVLLAIIPMMCCSNAHSKELEPPYIVINMKDGDKLFIDGVLDYRGEAILYTSEEARKLRLIFPYCVSGISDMDKKQLDHLIGKRAKLYVEVLSIKADDVSLGMSTRSLTDGVSINNWCLGDRAIRIIRAELRELR